LAGVKQVALIFRAGDRQRRAARVVKIFPKFYKPIRRAVVPAVRAVPDNIRRNVQLLPPAFRRADMAIVHAACDVLELVHFIRPGAVRVMVIVG